MKTELIGGPLDGAFVKVGDPPPKKIQLALSEVSIPPVYGIWPCPQPIALYVRHQRKGGRFVYLSACLKLSW